MPLLTVACAVQDTGFELAVHPSSLVMLASLGNVNVTDTTLPEDNPYRKVRTCPKHVTMGACRYERSKARALHTSRATCACRLASQGTLKLLP